MSEAGTGEGTPRLDEVERALVLAREVAAATAGGGGANIRTAHLRSLFANGSAPPPSPARMQAALEAAGLRAVPPLTDDPDSVSLHVEGDRAALAKESPVGPRKRAPAPRPAPAPSRPEPRRPGSELDFDQEPAPRPRYEPRRAARAPEPEAEHDPDFDDDLPASPRFGAAAYEAAASTDKPRRDDLDREPVPDDEPELDFEEPELEYDNEDEFEEPLPEEEPETDPDAPLRLSDMERLVAERRSHEVNPGVLAALMPALIIPVLVAAFMGPLFGAIFAGLCLLAAGLLSRPYALADGKVGPFRLPHTLTRTFLVLSILTVVLAVGLTIALIAAGGDDTSGVDESAPLQQEETTTPTTTPPAPPPDNNP